VAYERQCPQGVERVVQYKRYGHMAGEAQTSYSRLKSYSIVAIKNPMSYSYQVFFENVHVWDIETDNQRLRSAPDFCPSRSAKSFRNCSSSAARCKICELWFSSICRHVSIVYHDSKRCSRTSRQRLKTASSISPPLSIFLPAFSNSLSNIRPRSRILTMRAQISSPLPLSAGSQIMPSNTTSLFLSSSSPLSSAYPLFFNTCTFAASDRHRLLSLRCRRLHSTVLVERLKSCILSNFSSPWFISTSLPRRVSRFSFCPTARLPSSKKPRTAMGMDPAEGFLRRAASHAASSSREVGP